MRFHWLRDRIDQGQFRVVFVPGLRNLVDFFTKFLSVARHKVLAPFIATDDDDVVIDTVQLRLTNILFAAALLHNSHQAASGCVDGTVVGRYSLFSLYCYTLP
jgi:hypothetical protein